MDKPEGLWNDEYISWYIASLKDTGMFLHKMFQNCHTPLYYFYLKIWMFMFPDTDYSLRVSSVIPSLLSIPVMFFTGKELKDAKTGLLCAFLTAISSFHIYFAQEVRLYSLLFLFAALSVLYFIKSAKSPSKINIFLFILFQALVTAVHTLGIIWSAFYISALFVYLCRYTDFIKRKSDVYKYTAPFLFILLLLVPSLYSIVTLHSISQFWGGFSFTKVLLNFVDYFSPLQINIINTASSIISYIYKNGSIKFVFVIFGLLPVLIAFFALFKSIQSKNKIIKYLLISSGLFFGTLIILSAFHKMILITKYSTEIYPVLLLCIAFGFAQIKNTFIKKSLITIFIFLQLFYLLSFPNAVQKRTRTEGNKIVAQLIKSSKLKEGETILLTYYDKDRFDRYIETNKYRFLSVSKYNFNYIMFDGENVNELEHNGKYKHKDFFENVSNSILNDYYKNFILYKTHTGDRVGIIFLDSVAFLSDKQIKTIINDEYKLKHTPFLFLVFSSLRNNITELMKQDYKTDSITTNGDWTLVVYEKIH